MNKNFTYISNPVTVEAFKLSDLESTNTIQMPSWLFPAITDGTLSQDGNGWVCRTKQGHVTVNKSDWLIRLSDGEIYPCSDEVFELKYSKVPEVRDAAA